MGEIGVAGNHQDAHTGGFDLPAYCRQLLRRVVWREQDTDVDSVQADGSPHLRPFEDAHAPFDYFREE
jgi:hypothetical protein